MNVWEGNDRNYGETGGFCTRTTRQSTTHCPWSNFWLIKTSLCLSTHPTRQTSLPVTSTSSQRTSQCSKKLILCRKKMWEQKWRKPSTALRNMTCGIALNIGSIVCSCVSTQKGNILKAILVYFLNLLIRKSYRYSLFLCVCVGPRTVRQGTAYLQPVSNLGP